MLMVEYYCPQCHAKQILRVNEDRQDPEEKHPICPSCGEQMNFCDSWEDVSGCPEYVGDNDDE